MYVFHILNMYTKSGKSYIKINYNVKNKSVEQIPDFFNSAKTSLNTLILFIQDPHPFLIKTTWVEN